MADSRIATFQQTFQVQADLFVPSQYKGRNDATDHMVDVVLTEMHDWCDSVAQRVDGIYSIAVVFPKGSLQKQLDYLDALKRDVQEGHSHITTPPRGERDEVIIQIARRARYSPTA